MKSTMIAKVEKRIMAVMLSLVMVVGVFAGMKLDVQAAETYIAGENLQPGTSVKYGDKIVVPAPKSGNHSVTVVISNPGGIGTYWQNMTTECTDKRLEDSVPASTWKKQTIY